MASLSDDQIFVRFFLLPNSCTGTVPPSRHFLWHLSIEWSHSEYLAARYIQRYWDPVWSLDDNSMIAGNAQYQNVRDRVSRAGMGFWKAGIEHVWQKLSLTRFRISEKPQHVEEHKQTWSMWVLCHIFHYLLSCQITAFLALLDTLCWILDLLTTYGWPWSLSNSREPVSYTQI